jgi:probable HAF family extracellular repeat protein
MRTPLRPLAAAIGLALFTLLSPASAAPVAAHWTVTDLGTLGGNSSGAYGINASGQVTGSSYITGNAVEHGFLYSNGSMTDLGTLGGTSSAGYGINAAAQVTGSSFTAGNSSFHAFLYSNGSMTDLGTLGGRSSQGNAVNASGQVTGYSDTSGDAARHAFLYSNGRMTDLNTLGGTASLGNGINAAGQVTGYSNTTGNAADHAFLYSNGRMTDLGTLTGTYSYGSAINAAGQVTGFGTIAGDFRYHTFLYSNGNMTDLGTLGGSNSYGYAINAAGQIAGRSNITGSVLQHAFLYSNGSMTDLNTLNGVAGRGLTLNEARGMNDVGQIAGTGEDASGNSHAFVLTLDTTVWEGGSSGSFSSGVGWSFLTAPNKNTGVFIDPTVSATIDGPSVNTDVKQLTVGGGATGNNGIATLRLNGGTINVLGDIKQETFTTITAKGVLTGDGTINGLVSNSGTVNAVNLTLPGGLTNHGTVTGNGVLSTTLTNSTDGLLRVGAGQLLRVNGTGHVNRGSIEVRGGGELQFAGAVSGQGGTVVVDSATARFNGGLTHDSGSRLILSNGATAYFNGPGLSNGGQVQVTFGGANIFGAVTTVAGGKIILTGNSNTTFYDAVDVQSDGELRVSTGSAVVFFGQVFQRTGSIFSGTGTKFYEGGLAIGGSPGLGIDGGDVNFGAGNVFIVDIGGTTSCTADCGTNDALRNGSFDKYVVGGHLSLGGTLKLASWNGFVAQTGQTFDLLDWGSVDGRFDSIDTSGLLLADGLQLDTSRLAVDGSFSVVAVPEAGTWAMLLAGLAVLTRRGCLSQRRRQTRRFAASRDRPRQAGQDTKYNPSSALCPSAH